jgi:hypothetical protein
VKGSSSLVKDRGTGSRLLTEEIERLSDGRRAKHGSRGAFDEFQFEFCTGFIHHHVIIIRYRCEKCFGCFALDADLACLQALSSSSIIGL